MLKTLWPAGLAVAALLAWRVVPAFVARFDGRVMRVEPLRRPMPLRILLNGAQQRDWDELHAWCFDGAGPGGRPFWRPWGATRVDSRFAIATLARDPEAAHAATIESLCWHLDGSGQLAAAGSALAGLRLRLRVKFLDVLWWRTRQPADPWDCGHLIGGPEALRALQQFRPRRATLMVATGLDDATLREASRTLEANCARFEHPVRLLVVA